jgi:hypothetical protein
MSLLILLLQVIWIRFVVELLGCGVLELSIDKRVFISDWNIWARDPHHCRMSFALFLVSELVDLRGSYLTVIIHAVVKKSFLLRSSNHETGTSRGESKSIYHLVGGSIIRIRTSTAKNWSWIVVAIELFRMWVFLGVHYILQLVLHGETLVKNKGVLIHLWLVWRNMMIVRLIHYGLCHRWRVAMILLILMDIGIHSWLGCFGFILS